jgi:vacuolar protein sorting-associated protein 13A/C
MNLEMAATPIIFRASYRDINLILAIVNRAIALSTPPTPEKSTDSTALAQSSSAALASDVKSLSPGAARVVMAKEQVCVLSPLLCIQLTVISSSPPTSKDSN